MAVKYECSKCQRRFIDWAIDKIKEGVTCDECTGEHLLSVGAPIAAKKAKSPSLKRAPKKKAAAKKKAASKKKAAAKKKAVSEEE